MPVRYTVTEADGFKHTRISRSHAQPIYTHAVVRVPHGSKASVSYSSRLDLAQQTLAEAMKPLVDNSFTRKHHPDLVGKPFYSRAKIYPVTAEIL
jgi:hypothetical protein